MMRRSGVSPGRGAIFENGLKLKRKLANLGLPSARFDKDAG